MLMPLMSMLHQTRFTHGAKQLGEVWKPGGTKVFDLPAKGVDKPAPPTCIVSGAAIECVASRDDARSGFRIQGFGSDSGIVSAAVHDADGAALGTTRSQVIRSTGKAEVSLIVDYDGKTSLSVTYADGRDPVCLSLDKDTRIGWENGEPVIAQGAKALDGGVLAAEGKDEILVRVSGADVAAGDGTTVINLSDKGGTFSGGAGVTYQGRYTDSVFEYDNAGAVDFAGFFSNTSITAKNSRAAFSGVFEYSDIAAGGTGSVFSGFFEGTAVTAESGDNIFSGLFLGRSAITAGDGNDTFSGHFVNSDIDAGNGGNSFGAGIDLAAFNQMQSGFTGTRITSGNGKDRFFGKAFESVIDLGDGDDEVKGVFMDSRVTAGSGDDSIAAMYGNGTVFDAGDGDDLLALGTGFASSLIAGSGNNRVIMGYNGKGRGDSSSGLYGVGAEVRDSTWLTFEETEWGNIRPKEFGELSGNTLDASQGENRITVHSGQASHSISTGAMREEDAAETPGEAMGETAAIIQESLVEEAAFAEDASAEADGAPVRTASAVEAATKAGDEERRMRVSGDPLRDGGLMGVAIDGGTGETLSVLTDDRFMRSDERAGYIGPEIAPSRAQIASGNAVNFRLFVGLENAAPEIARSDASGERRRAVRAYYNAARRL